MMLFILRLGVPSVRAFNRRLESLRVRRRGLINKIGSEPRIQSFVIGRGVLADGQPSAEIIESSPTELLAMIVRNMTVAGDVQQMLGTFARLCRSRIEEIVSAGQIEREGMASCFNCGKTLPKAEMHELAGFEGDEKAYACASCYKTTDTEH